jgi:hypothetical protein
MDDLVKLVVIILFVRNIIWVSNLSNYSNTFT